MIRKKDAFTLEHKQVGGGIGQLEFHHKFSKEETFGKCRICAEITLQPGETIGKHAHVEEMEIYYMLSGELVSVAEDGAEEPFVAGDSMVTGGGASHAVRNDSAKPATMLAVVIL